MTVRSARPSASSLMLHVYRRSVHPELFDERRSGVICRDGYRASFYICDAGHVIEFRDGQGTLTEVTAPQHSLLPERKRCIETRLRGSRDETLELPGGLRYHVGYQLEVLDPEVFVHYHEELELDFRNAHLGHRFAPQNRLSPGPLSFLLAESNPRSLQVHTFHTFPEEFSVVKTQSLFELTEL